MSASPPAPCLKGALLALGCPLIKPEEKREDVEHLLTSDANTADRRAILEWIVDKVQDEAIDTARIRPTPVQAEDEDKVLATRLASMGIPKQTAFVKGHLDRDEQRRTWSLLVEMAAWQEQEREREDGAQETVEDLMRATWARREEADKARHGHDAKAKRGLVPRDLDKEVRQAFKKVAAPNRKKLGQILDMYKKTTDDVRSYNEVSKKDLIKMIKDSMIKID